MPYFQIKPNPLTTDERIETLPNVEVTQRDLDDLVWLILNDLKNDKRKYRPRLK